MEAAMSDEAKQAREMRPSARRLVEVALTLMVTLLGSFIVIAFGGDALLAVGVGIVVCALVIAGAAVWEKRIRPQPRMATDATPVPAVAAPRPLRAAHEAALRSVVARLGAADLSNTERDRLIFEDLKIHFPDNPVWADQVELESTSKRYWDGKYEYRTMLYEILETWGLRGTPANLIETAFDKRMEEWRSGRLTAQPSWGWSYIPGVDGIGAATLEGNVMWPLATPEEYEANQRHVTDLWLMVQGWESAKDYAWLGPRINQLKGQIASARAALELANFDGTGPCPNC